MTTPLKVFSLEVDTVTKSISPHVRQISPDNVLKDLYRILNCNLVTCIEIEVGGQLFDVWSDDEALLKAKPVPNLYIDDELIFFGSIAFAKADEEGKMVGLSHEEIQLLWKFSIVQFDKLLNYLQRRKIVYGTILPSYSGR